MSFPGLSLTSGEVDRPYSFVSAASHSVFIVAEYGLRTGGRADQDCFCSEGIAGVNGRAREALVSTFHYSDHC